MKSNVVTGSDRLLPKVLDCAADQIHPARLTTDSDQGSIGGASGSASTTSR
jgi:hypothetical protein